MMPEWAVYALAALAGYLAGSVPFGLVITKAAGLGDIRDIGSHSIGATNVLRTGRKDLALATFLLVTIYWSSWSLNGSKASDDLNVSQKLAVLSQIVFRGSASDIDLVKHSTELLHLLRTTVYASIGLACIYFLLIVTDITHS